MEPNKNIYPQENNAQPEALLSNMPGSQLQSNSPVTNNLNPGAIVSGDFTPNVPQPASMSPNLGPLANNQPPSPFPSTSLPFNYSGANEPLPLPRKRKLLKPILIILLAVIILGGASAAAYFAVIVPNQPANILKTALINTVEQKQINYNATFNADPKSSTSGLAAKVTANGQFDKSTNSIDSNINLTISVVNVGADIRYINQNLYIKPGDLSALSDLASTIDPSLVSPAQTISSQLSNKWIVIDSTLLKQAGLSCALDGNHILSPSDIKLLENLYIKNPFVSILSTSSGSISGQPAERFNINVDNNKAASYLDSLNNLPEIKALYSCQGSQKAPLNLKGDNKITPISLWVDKTSKRIVQISLVSSDQTLASTGERLSLVVNLAYKPVNITEPSGAQPALNVITNLEKSLGVTPATSGLNLNNLLNSSTGPNTITQ